MAIWIITSLASATYSGHFLFYFRGEGEIFLFCWWNFLGTLYSVCVIRWTSYVYFTLLTSVSLSICFLLIDRCLVIVCLTYYSINYRSKFEAISLILVIVNFCAVFGSHIYMKPSTEDGYTTCLSASCVGNRQRNPISIIVKFGYAALNCLFASIFAIIYFKYNETRVVSSQINTKRLATNFVEIKLTWYWNAY